MLVFRVLKDACTQCFTSKVHSWHIVQNINANCQYRQYTSKIRYRVQFNMESEDMRRRFVN